VALVTRQEKIMVPSRTLLLRFTAAYLIVSLGLPAIRVEASDKKEGLQYGVGLIVNVPFSQADVLKAVDEVVQNGKIRGTKEYNKDEFVGGASPVDDSTAFPAWTDGGKVFYKERQHALDPRNFKESNDVGALTVRYVVMGQDDKHTVVRIDAVFVEEFRHKVHLSDGTVETAEYKEIHDRLESMQMLRDQAAEMEKEKQEATQKKFEGNSSLVASPSDKPAAEANASQPQGTVISESSSIDDLKKRIHELKLQTQKRVKTSATPLKSAPFHTATNLQTLNAGTEVLIVISTPYWFGIETHTGQHGWVMRNDLEDLP